MSRERMQKALDGLLYLPHLKEQHSEEASLPVAPPPLPPGSSGKGRPFDRGDLFRRLATFKSGTWFCKPDAISPVACARRGWTNTASDLLTCEFCRAKLSCPIPADLLPEEAATAAARYAPRLGEAHDAACPWRTASSSATLLQFPPLTQEAVRRDFEGRCAALDRLACLPPVAAEPYDALVAASSKGRLDALLLQGPPALAAVMAAAAGSEDADARAAVAEGTSVLGSRQFEARARMLALCGWDFQPLMAAPASAGSPGSQPAGGATQLPLTVGPESAALHCSLCSAKAGLWTFFPQCKPVVLQPPARRGSAVTGTATPPSAAVAKASVSRNVAADIGTTIAGGAMSADAAVGTAVGTSPAPFGSPAAAGGSGGVPAFGFAALQAAKPAAEAGGSTQGPRPALDHSTGQKRKQPDFSWTAVMADIDARAAAEKRGKAGGVAGGGGDAGAAGAGRGAPPTRQQQLAAAAAAAVRYQAVQATAMDPLALHRPFCPWVNAAQAGEQEGRCGWRWCLQQLAAPAALGDVALAADAGGAGDSGGKDGGRDGGGGKDWDPASLLRKVLRQVDVGK